MRKLFLLGFVGMLSLAGSTQAQAAAEPIPAAAQQAAETWLKLLDNNKWDESWRTGAQVFRTAIKIEKWRLTGGKERKPFGRFLSRKLKTQRMDPAKAGSPTLRNATFEYGAAFQFKKEASETVTASLEKDGKWRVSGYYIR